MITSSPTLKKLDVMDGQRWKGKNKIEMYCESMSNNAWPGALKTQWEKLLAG
jgi:hypothetical protein